jgi:hypothetical protein
LPMAVLHPVVPACPRWRGSCGIPLDRCFQGVRNRKPAEVAMKLPQIGIAILIVLMMPVLVNAGTSIGIVGGVNIASLDANFVDVDDKGRTAVGIGGSLEIDFNEMFAIQVQPMYLQKGEELSEILTPVSIKLKPSYLEIPVLFKAYPVAAAARPYLMAGPSLGFLLSHKAEITDGTISVEADLKDVSETVDWSIVFGGGIAAPAGPGNLFVDLRYALGLTDINKGGTVTVAGLPALEIDPVDAKTRGFQIMGGVSFPLGGN